MPRCRLAQGILTMMIRDCCTPGPPSRPIALYLKVPFLNRACRPSAHSILPLSLEAIVEVLGFATRRGAIARVVVTVDPPTDWVR